MKLSHKLTIPLAAFALIAVGAVSTVAFQSHAQTATDSTTTTSSQTTQPTNPMASLVQAIAQKFNLNQSDVQQVFDDQRSQMDQQREQDFANQLSQAVTDGKLTQDQADKITAKEKELDAQREADKTSFQTMTDAQRQAQMKSEMDSLKQWATDNNIPQQYLPMGGGFGGKHGPRGFAGAPNAATSSTTTSSTQSN